MRQLIVIQCHLYDPAVKLGELILGMSKDFDVFYAYDESSEDSDKFKLIKNSEPFKIGYFTESQGKFHLDLWDYIHKYKSNYDYYHLMSESDLPSFGLLNFEDTIKGNLAYGFYHEVNINDKLVNKAVMWYGLSREVVRYISNAYSNLLVKFKEIYKFHESEVGMNRGSFDEYALGYLLNRIDNKFKYLNESLRLVLWSKTEELTFDNFRIKDYGKIKYVTQPSPLTLLDTKEVRKVLLGSYHISARKFEFESKDYNTLYNLIRNGK